MTVAGARAFAVWNDGLGDRWDLKGAKAFRFRAEHPNFVPLGQFVEERTELVRPSLRPDDEWPVYGVSNVDGVFLSHMQLGRDFKAPYKRIEEDWFFHNPTRANVGSLGRVPDVPQNAITSPEYQVWSISDPQWSPDYVEALIKMPFFNYLVQIHRVGAVKERLYTSNLMEMPVPPHGPAFQQRIVDEWKALNAEVSKALARIGQHEDQLVADVLSDCGITLARFSVRPKAIGVWLDDLDRWSVAFNRQTWTLDDLLTTDRFAREPLGDVAAVNPKRTKLVALGSNVSFVPMEAVSAVSGSIEFREDVLIDDVLKGYTPFEEGDVIWAKITPCMQNGKSAVASNLTNGVGFGSTEFHVIRPNEPDKLLSDYLWVLLRLHSIRTAAERYFIGSAGQQRVPAEFLEQLVIPIPPVDVQRTVVKRVQKQRALVQSERSHLTAAWRSGLRELESKILTGRA